MAKMLMHNGVLISKSSQLAQTLEAIKSANKAQAQKATPENAKLLSQLKAQLPSIEAAARKPFDDWFPNFKPYRVGDHLPEVMAYVREHGFEGVNCEFEVKG
jgi:hypothetical protein